jgi:hypothetical protein
MCKGGIRFKGFTGARIAAVKNAPDDFKAWAMAKGATE